MKFVAVQKVWVQVSADYQSAENTRTIVVDEAMTVGELMRQIKKAHVLGSGDVVITEADELMPPKEKEDER